MMTRPPKQRVRWGDFPASTLLVMSVAAAVFGLVLTAVSKGRLSLLDHSLVSAASKPGLNGLILQAVRDFSAFGSVAVVTVLLIGATLSLSRDRDRSSALTIVVTAIGAQISAEIAKALIDRPRPELLPHAVYSFSDSFPSGHAALAAAAFPTMAWALTARSTISEQNAAMALAVVLAGLVGASRVVLGVHWPTDVIAGWSLGAIWACSGMLAISASRHRKQSQARTPR